MIDFKSYRTRAELVEAIKAAPDIPAATSAQAMKYIRQHLPEESWFQKNIKKAVLEARPDAFAWKAAAGPYGRAGIPDICAIIGGTFYGFEVKRPFLGEISKLQEKTAEAIRKAGGKVYFVSWPEEVHRILQAEAEHEAGRSGGGKSGDDKNL